MQVSPLYRILMLLLFCLPLLTIKAQRHVKADSLPGHSPKKAALLSAVLPGAGQFYNKKYWKIGVVAAGTGALVYSYRFNTRYFRLYKNELILREQNSGVPDPELARYTNGNLLELQNFYRRNRDLTVIGFGLLYALNILDATVDAHLFDFNLDASLSMKVQPDIQFMPGSAALSRGISLQINF